MQPVRELLIFIKMVHLPSFILWMKLRLFLINWTCPIFANALMALQLMKLVELKVQQDCSIGELLYAC
ncbi:hypothetical protein P353_15435 [Comamonas testosteroni]|uniref:Uncharacterized protein n=1 Tax=Comamonas testosteroni TaxID=285 RepID=A0A096FE22_COMTE|nr:hypothetical protein P353_15435 [Comamonas testosteroni]